MPENFTRKIISIIFPGIILFFPCTVAAQQNSLRSEIEAITRSVDGKVGVAVMNLDSRDTLTVHGKDHYPMQSVYKFPLALAVLDQVDRGKLSLEQKIHISQSELIPNTWSPLAKKYPEGNVDVPLRELLRYTVSQSDNNACDMLFRLIGGPKKAEEYIQTIGVKDITMVNTEAEMHKDWEAQFANWSRPTAMVQLLELSFKKDILSKSSKDLLYIFMTETTTGLKRIKGLLPKETIVLHKTGTSGTSDTGITPAINDVGIMILPGGQQVAIAVFVSNTSAGMDAAENVIARISKAVYDHYTEGRK